MTRRRVLSLRIKAQYITYLAAGLVGLLLLFAICYIMGVPTYVTLMIVLVSGFFLFSWVTNASRKYGEHGLMKEAAYKRVPAAIVCRSRKVFTRLKNEEVGNDSVVNNDGDGSTGRANATAEGKSI